MYLGIDIGGTKTLVALLDESGAIVKETRLPTEKDYPTFLKNLQAAITSVAAGNSYNAVAVGSAGLFTPDRSTLIKWENVGWHNKPYLHDLQVIVQAPCVLENDAKTAGLGEAINIKDEFKRVLSISIGTGVGVAFTANGIIDHSVNDLGGSEFPVTYKGQQVPSWEELVAGRILVKEYGKQADQITDPAIWQEYASRLTAGLVPLINTYRPDVIVFGGGVADQLEQFQAPLLECLQNEPTLPAPLPAIRQAQNTDLAVIYGCYQLILQQVHQGHETAVN